MRSPKEGEQMEKTQGLKAEPWGPPRSRGHRGEEKKQPVKGEENRDCAIPEAAEGNVTNLRMMMVRRKALCSGAHSRHSINVTRS